MSSPSKQQDEPDLIDSELDSYIISVPDLSKAKKASKSCKPPATPTKGDKKSKKARNDGTPSIVSEASPTKSASSTSSSEEEGTPSKKKTYGWFGTDARVYTSPIKGSSRKA